MDAELVKVRIAAPAKLGGRWLKPGDEPEVTAEEMAALDAAGLIEPATSAPEALAPAEGGSDEAADAQIRTMAFTMFDGELVRLEAEVKSIMATAEAEVAAAKAERDALIARIAELEGQLKVAVENKSPAIAGEAGVADSSNSTSPPGGEAAPATTDTPPKVAKTAPKKGAVATTKG